MTVEHPRGRAPVPWWRGLGAATLGAALLVAAGACGSSSGPGRASGTIASTIVAGPSTSAPPIPPATPISVPKATDGTSPDGSGCDPPEGDTLPDGIWYGILKSATPATATTPGTIGLDLACWYSGTSAQAITHSSRPVDDDVYVRNQNPKVYAVPTIAGVAVVPLAKAPNGEPTGGLAPATMGLAGIQAILTGPGDHGVWVVIDQGLATVVQSQFKP